MSIRVPVKHKFDAPLDAVIKAYRGKMNSRIEATKGVRVVIVRSGPTMCEYKVIRPMPVWFRVLGGADSTEYVETLRIEEGRMVTSAYQNLPFGGKAQTRITFMQDGDSLTRVFGTVSASDLPPVASNVAKRVFKSFVESTFQKERESENQLLA
tara:strand:+ start:98 stop:559 length:462 start_codon:yes stop_codon:yes gene_type:complete